MQVALYTFGQAEVRTIAIDGEPWFVAMDVARILGYSDTQAMTRRLDDEDIRKIKTDDLSGLDNRFGNNDITIVNESGIYSCILGSVKPEAKTFKRWVTSEVLPSISI